MGVARSEDAALDALRRRFLENGDEAAMEDLVRRTRPRLLGAARRIGHPQDAEDSVQSAYHALLQRGAAAIEGPVVAWLLTAVVRIAYRRKAEARRRDDIARRLAPRNPDPDPASRLGEQEEARALRAILERLPAKYRDALVLHHLQGLSVADVADLLETPESTIKARLRRGRALLRSRIPPALQLGLLLVPWNLADGWNGLTARIPSIAGAAMNAKTAAAALVAALVVAGGVGYAVLRPEQAPGSEDRAAGAAVHTPAGTGTPVAKDGASTPAPAVPSSDRGMPDGSVPPATAAAPAAPEKTAPAEVPAWKKDLPDSVIAAAAAAGITDAALKAAWDAYESGKANMRKGPYGIVSKEALDALRSQGQDGFRAVAALLKAGQHGTWFRDLVQASWSPGLEGPLIEVADDAKLGQNPRWTALDSMGQADCAGTRDYLVGRLARETDGYLVWGVVRSLAVLREPRGAESTAALIEEKSYGDVIRNTLISCLGEMDPAVAKRVLVERMRTTGADLLDGTATALARLDPEAAKREAEAILDGPRAEGLSRTVLRALRLVAGRSQSADGSR